MKKRFTFLMAVAFSGLFFACDDEGIPVPLPPPLPTAQADDSALLKQDNKKTDAKSKEKAAPAQKEVAKKETKSAKPAALSCAATATCDTDSEQLSSGRYTVQIAVYPSESSARSLVRKMSANGIKAYYAEVDSPAQLLGLYYRVRVGYFNGIAEAEDFARSRLEPLGYAWWVDKRKNDRVGNAGSNNYASYTFTPSAPADDEVEAAKQAYREQLASEQSGSGTTSKRKKKTRNKSSDNEFEWDD